ncbi:hypothetical protein Poli38472_006888 [Pythium oligandrum]|uniref:BRO1 domain-containing protein n=1 Tax=Pythium oligandrum TaxID=41045 RepID=A0A8K1FFJ6_PYTOL|nr:hypothetical protein Poli38472_006888 [Pythium oligandrum]|eukprot:TMW56878.1 hypothetical protein Poli38472_006888 [Pythium oligandrum]
MLGIGFKASDTPLPSLQRPLREYIQREYASSTSASDESAHDQALDQFFQLKADVDLVRTPSTISRHVLLKYYAQLERLATRFPCDPTTEPASATSVPLRLQFTWNDSFCPRKKITQTSVRFEQAAVMFNYGALESQLGVQTDRSSADGLKTACKHFMLAAGAFTVVRDELVAKCLGARTPDMSPEGLGMLIALMLAQAQACFYEKAIKDQMKDAIKAKLVHQAQDFYSGALDFCNSSALNGTIDRMWAIHIRFQVHCMRAATQYWQAKAAKEVALGRGVGYGEEIARLEAADVECQEAIKVVSQNKLPPSLGQSAKALQRVIREQLHTAKKDNASVYLENVPRFVDLPAVGKASMVKPLALTNEELSQELNGVDLFEHFVPNVLLRRAADAKDEIKELLTDATERVTKSHENVKEKLQTMGLPASIEAFEKTSDNGIPQSIWQKVENVQATHGLHSLRLTGSDENDALWRVMHQRLAANDGASERAEKSLHGIECKLAQEEIEDNGCRQNYGANRWQRPTSSSLSQGFRADIDRYYRLVKEAKQSDRVVEDKLEKHRSLISLLTQTKASLDAQLPMLEHDNTSCRDEIDEVSQLLMRISTAMEEKDQVLHDFGASFEKFNPLPALLSAVSSSGNDTADALLNEKRFFEDHFVTKLTVIDGEEKSHLEELVIANQKFESKKATDSVMQARQAFLQRLSDAVDVVEQLHSHLKEGAKFYEELGSRIEQLQQTVNDHCSARDLERRELELNVAADEEMKKREAQDAAVAQKMMRDMQIQDPLTDEALARQLAANTPQHYPSMGSTAQQAVYTASSASPYDYSLFQQQHQQSQASNGFVYNSSASASAPSPAQHPYAQYQHAQMPPISTSSTSAPPPAYNSIFTPSPSSPSAPQFGNFYMQQPPPQPQHGSYHFPASYAQQGSAPGSTFPRGPSNTGV